MHLSVLGEARMDKLHDLALEAARQILAADPEFPELIELARQLQETAFSVAGSRSKGNTLKEDPPRPTDARQAHANEASEATRVAG
jgi:hypothetical protein